MEKVTVTVERDGNFSAFIEILPGCVTTGANIEEIERNMLEAIESHLSVAKEFGDPIPEVLQHEYLLEFHYQVDVP